MTRALRERSVALLTLLGLAIAIEVGLSDLNTWFSLSLNIMELTSSHVFAAQQPDARHIGMSRDIGTELLRFAAAIIRSHWA